MAETGTAVPPCGMKALTKIIICEMAVLKERVSMSSVTFLIVACITFCCAFVSSTSWTAVRQLPFARLILLP